MVLRKFAGEGLRGTVEFTEILLVVAVFLGMTGAETTRTHLRTPIVVERLPARLGGWLIASGLIVAALCTAWTTWASAGSALASFQSHEIRYGLLGLPLWPAKATVPLGMFGFTVALAVHAFSAAQAALAGRSASDERGNVL
ncbi:TRAP transporter small permease [Aeromicrobium sp.]|uniref:TRAP transporter small permease n=1 Tax=Aeromicrobium sp. TaxID=1871063 RepID=UPI0028B1BDC9|nr:TRAP transporter small permease [Aeromicrobium sp.]